MASEKISVALVGLGFGGAFARIWKDHPQVGRVVLFDADEALCRRVAQETGIAETVNRFEDILEDDSLDAVHLVTPIPCHEDQTVAVLQSGKHCACTVPMATSIQGIERIAKAMLASKKRYMAMETALYTIHYFYAREMLARGDFGHIQFLRGAHYQDMAHWPAYWMGLPPMHYATHAISPIAKLAGARITRVMGLGSGQMQKALVEQYQNPFPVETALLTFENGLKGEVTRSLFETARDYTESFCVYGSKRTFEWGQLEHDAPLVMTLGAAAAQGQRGLPVQTERVMPRNRPELLPEAIQKYTVRSKDYDETNPQRSLTQGAAGGHWGSHPHLVNEFVQSILQDREPYADFSFAANVCAAGILAHLSALRDGEPMDVPVFSDAEK